MLGLTLFAFGIGVASNTLDPAVLSLRLSELAPDSRSTALGLITAAGLLAATITQPIAGALSDKSASRFGPRIPFILLGTGSALVGMFVVALAPGLALLAMGMLGFQIAANSAQGPWQALVPDQVPHSARGAAAGIKTVLEILAFILGRWFSGYLVADGGALDAVAVAALTFFAAGAITALAAAANGRSLRHGVANLRARDRDPGGIDSPPVIQPIAWPPGFGWWFANRALFWAGVIAVSTFVLFYLEDVVGMPFDEAARFFARLSVVLGVSTAIVTLPAGRLSDRIGRRPVILASCALAVAGNLVLLAARSQGLLIVAGAALGLAGGVFLSSTWALATDMAPPLQAARYLGIANIASAGGSFLGRLAGGLVIDPVNRALASDSAGYLALYWLTLILFLLAAATALKLPRPSRGRSGV